jgi:hypothetical protein
VSLSADWGDFLASAPEGSIISLLSQEGQAVTVTAGERYASASGRECRRFRVEGDNEASGAGQPRIACATPQGWRVTRRVVATTIGE